MNQERQHLQLTKPTSPSNTTPHPDIFIDSSKNIIEQIKTLTSNVPYDQPFDGTIEKDILQDAFPSSNILNIKTNDVCYTIVDIPPKNKVFTDLTGRLPYLFSCNYQ